MNQADLIPDRESQVLRFDDGVELAVFNKDQLLDMTVHQHGAQLWHGAAQLHPPTVEDRE